jgi:uncharacterized protein (DUF1697 family)
MKYIAFLRAVNVGGYNKIKMEDLKKMFLSLGYKNAKTVIQSGNVIFETSDKSIKSITSKIEERLYEFMKKEIRVFIRTHQELFKIVRQNPFGKIKTDDNIKTYVFFLYKDSGEKIKIPFMSHSGEVNIFSQIELNLFMLVKKIPGKASSPNDLIEKTFKVPATARNWDVICNIIEKASTGE